MSPNVKSRATEVASEVLAAAARVPSAVAGAPARLRDPMVQSDLLLLTKAAAAATAAWLLAVQVFALPQPFLAPWSALLTVHATVYRSVSRGVQQVSATVLGVLLSFVLAELLGINGLTLFVVLVGALLLARVGVLRDEGVTVATTALFVLTTGYGQQESMLGDRILATALGIGVGVLVNLAVVPPLNQRSAAQHVDHVDRLLGDLLQECAQAVRGGATDESMSGLIEKTRSLDRELEHAWEVVGFARESTRLNPRQRRTRRERGDDLPYEQILYRLEDGISETRSMARTLLESTFAEHEWDHRFREPWLDVLASVGERVHSPDAWVVDVRGRLDALTRGLSVGALPDLRWPLYGALITNVRHIVDILDDVATHRSAREQDGHDGHDDEVTYKQA
ncbi:MAG: aromatic acid exporter family protein [Actinomycetota bacterium]|nr:aromatic acid exporter family protein [Actinomycetota bacterium]